MSRWLRCGKGIRALFEHKGTDRTDFHTFTALRALRIGHGSVLEGRDHPLEATTGEPDSSDAETLPAYPHTFPAEDTLVGVVVEEGTTVVHGESPFELLEPLALQLEAQMFGNRLELTQSVFCTMAAVHSMTGNEQLSRGSGQP